MTSIMDLAKTEAMLFKFGSGAGSNLSTIRSSREKMAGGGTASGPVSFMKGYDAFAGVVKCLTGRHVLSRPVAGSCASTRRSTPTGRWASTSDDSLTLNTPAGPDTHLARLPEPASRTSDRATLRTGLGLTGTHEHPVLTLATDFQLRWTRLADLRPGDRVAVERRRELWPAQAPALDLFESDLVRRAAAAALPDRDDPRACAPARLPGGRGVRRAGAVPLQLRRSRDHGRLLPLRRGRLRRRSAQPGPTAGSIPTTGVRTESDRAQLEGRPPVPRVLRPARRASADKAVPLADPPLAALARARVPRRLRRGRRPPRQRPGSRSRPRPRASLEEIQLLALNMGVVGRRSTINGYGRLAFLGAEAARLARLLRPYLVTPRKREAAAGLVAAPRPAGATRTSTSSRASCPRCARSSPGRNGWARATSGELRSRRASASSTASATTSRTPARGRSPASSTRSGDSRPRWAGRSSASSTTSTSGTRS